MKTPKVHFVTRNEFDVLSLTTMGISSKVTDNAIGKFGTGLKYAVSVLARLNHVMILKFHGKQWLVCKEKISFRGKEFDRLFLRAGPEDVIQLPFTTELGKEWELWMAYRELESNTLDEGGETIVGETHPEGELVISVHGADFLNVVSDRDKYFLNSNKRRVWSHGTVEAYEGTSNHIFYRGIAVHKLDKPTEYTYNLSHADLTEDRTLKNASFYINFHIAPALLEQDPIEVFNVVTNKGRAEYSINYEYSEPSQEFVAAIRDREKNSPLNVAPSLSDLFRSEKYRDVNDSKTYEPNAIEAKKLETARNFLDKAGFGPVPGFTEIVSDIPELGLCNHKHRVIVVSKRALDMGIREVVLTLLEERVHAKYMVPDYSHAMQNKLFEIIVQLIEKQQTEFVI